MILQVLRTARNYHQPPTAWFGGDGAWTDRDRLITLALTLYEAGLCGECGQPMEVCRDPSNTFEIHEDTCQARAAIDERRQADAKADPRPGQILSARLEDTTSVVYGANPFA